ncbi:hypothetical protein C8J57DRAFT_1234553 [Mycena rebaudengoi]|nr:hypothetical protein C8J57DRAFT_1234553 [Mycena rebaudengoi]
MPWLLSRDQRKSDGRYIASTAHSAACAAHSSKPGTFCGMSGVDNTRRLLQGGTRRPRAGAAAAGGAGWAGRGRRGAPWDSQARRGAKGQSADDTGRCGIRVSVARCESADGSGM